MKIKALRSLEILDSRGNPTIRTFVYLEDGSCYSSSVPSGASTGKYEAAELRDGDEKRYFGKGVLKAVENVNSTINQALTGMDAEDPKIIDQKMFELDGTDNKSKLGANAILSVSQAVVRAAAKINKIPLWKFINEYYFSQTTPSFPRLMVNIVNGGKHANWNFDIQEFMVVPRSNTPSESVKTAAEIFHKLGQNLKTQSLSTLLGDEGGYSPALSSNEEVLVYITTAAKEIGYTKNNVDLALDCAASEWVKDGVYVSHKTNTNLSPDELINYYLKLRDQYGILSYEDPFGEDDWESYQKFSSVILANKVRPESDPGQDKTPDSGQARLAEAVGEAQARMTNTLIVGDDLYVTNPKRIKKGIELHSTNAVLIKVNQIGSVLETVEAIKMTKNAGWKAIISHRSGETEDSFIADLAYASAAEFIKTGSMARSERLAKYNRLLEIENNL